jgi:lipoyl-dependent peroxiredoxin subunit C
LRGAAVPYSMLLDIVVFLRVTFIADPEGTIRYVSVNDLNVGRNVDEVVRTLDALQTDELCPCNWQLGQDTIKVA